MTVEFRYKKLDEPCQEAAISLDYQVDHGDVTLVEMVFHVDEITFHRLSTEDGEAASLTLTAAQFEKATEAYQQYKAEAKAAEPEMERRVEEIKQHARGLGEHLITLGQRLQERAKQEEAEQGEVAATNNEEPSLSHTSSHTSSAYESHVTKTVTLE